jgi:hypothetical protein
MESVGPPMARAFRELFVTAPSRQVACSRAGLVDQPRQSLLYLHASFTARIIGESRFSITRRSPVLILAETHAGADLFAAAVDQNPASDPHERRDMRDQSKDPGCRSSGLALAHSSRKPP